MYATVMTVTILVLLTSFVVFSNSFVERFVSALLFCGLVKVGVPGDRGQSETDAQWEIDSEGDDDATVLESGGVSRFPHSAEMQTFRKSDSPDFLLSMPEPPLDFTVQPAPVQFKAHHSISLPKPENLNLSATMPGLSSIIPPPPPHPPFNIPFPPPITVGLQPPPVPTIPTYHQQNVEPPVLPPPPGLFEASKHSTTFKLPPLIEIDASAMDPSRTQVGDYPLTAFISNQGMTYPRRDPNAPAAASVKLDFPSQLLQKLMCHYDEIFKVMSGLGFCRYEFFEFSAGYDVLEPLQKQFGMDGFGRGLFLWSNY